MLFALLACSDPPPPPPALGPVACWGATSGILNGPSVDPTTVDGFAQATSFVSTTGPLCAVVQGAIQCIGSRAAGWPDQSATPKPFTLVPDTVSLAFGSTHGCALRPDHTVACWGTNLVGNLGNGTAPDPKTKVLFELRPAGTVNAPVLPQGSSSDVPVPVTGITNAVELVAGRSFTCARLDTGSVRCWGDGSRGQLGNGGKDPSGVPVDVQGITDAIQIAASDDWACALRKTGTVACWGSTGDNTPSGEKIQDLTPREVEGVADITRIVTRLDSDRGGASRGAALTRDGKVYSFSSVGPAFLDSLLPPLKDIVAGTHHSCGRTATGDVWCWGDQKHQQRGATHSSMTVSQIPGLSGVVELGAGQFATCARR